MSSKHTKRRQAPAFQFYADDFLAGTMNLTDAEVGLYIRLLCIQWSAGSVPNDPAEAAQYGRGDTPTGRVLAKFEACDDGQRRNARLEAVRAEADAFRDKQTKNASTRWHQSGNATALPPHESGIGLASVWQCSPSPSPITKTTHTTREEGGDWAGDEGKPLPPMPQAPPSATPPPPAAKVPSLEDAKAHAATIACSPEEAERFWHHFEASGWIDKHGRAIASWRSRLTKWWADERARPAEAAHHRRNGAKSTRPEQNQHAEAIEVPTL